MKIDPGMYTHPSDRAAMAALQAIPGFSQVMKAFMKVWNEKQFKIMNMSTNLRLGPDQMPKYYNMLLPVCEKIGIEVPELYVSLDVNPNAYTYGDTNPFIVITSGMFETVPDELIPTVLAHECGHIACHHTLYTSMGRAILNGASAVVTGIGSAALYPVQLAFSYWMRCSEFSADRVAVLCDGGSDRTVEMCMRLAGFDKDISAEANVDAFLAQAQEYRQLIKDSTFNQALEFFMFNSMSHPLNAVRALESREWERNGNFRLISQCMNGSAALTDSMLPVELRPSGYIGRNVDEVRSELLSMGFKNIGTDRICEGINAKNDSVTAVAINGKTDCSNDFYSRDVTIILSYFEGKSDAEITMEHPGEIRMPENARYYYGKNIFEVMTDMKLLGYKNIVTREMAKSRLAFMEKTDSVGRIEIGSRPDFDRDSWFPADSEVVIYYYAK